MAFISKKYQKWNCDQIRLPPFFLKSKTGDLQCIGYFCICLSLYTLTSPLLLEIRFIKLHVGTHSSICRVLVLFYEIPWQDSKRIDMWSIDIDS